MDGRGARHAKPSNIRVKFQWRLILKPCVKRRVLGPTGLSARKKISEKVANAVNNYVRKMSGKDGKVYIYVLFVKVLLLKEMNTGTLWDASLKTKNHWKNATFKSVSTFKGAKKRVHQTFWQLISSSCFLKKNRKVVLWWVNIYMSKEFYARHHKSKIQF